MLDHGGLSQLFVFETAIFSLPKIISLLKIILESFCMYSHGESY
jgi:hypothetical protein